MRRSVRARTPQRCRLHVPLQEQTRLWLRLRQHAHRKQASSVRRCALRAGGLAATRTGLPEQYGVRASVFTEFGTLGLLDTPDQIDEGAAGTAFTIDDMALRASAGVSIFWDSPFGPVRFDFDQLV